MNSQPPVEKQLTLLPAGPERQEEAEAAGSPEERPEANRAETGNEDRADAPASLAAAGTEPGGSAYSAFSDDDEEELPLPAAPAPAHSDERPRPGKTGSTGEVSQMPDADDVLSDEGTLSADSGTEIPASSAAAPQAEPPAVQTGGGNGGDNLPPAVTHAQDAGQPAPPPNEEPMTLLDHLNELRHRLTRVVIMVMLGFIACYGVAEPIYGWLSAPLKAALPEGSKLIYTSPQGAFFVYLKVALVASVFLTSPFSFYQIWSFIAPGLYKEEKQAVMPLAFFSAFFFLAGASFCYYLVFPIAFQFFMGFATDVIVPMISVEEYLSFALKLLIAFGLVFEMPLFAYFLAKLGLLTPDMMRRQRKYAILAIFIIAAILTPPDVFSQCLMAAPMLFLYEVSIYVAASARKKRDVKAAKKAETEETAKAGAPTEGEAHDDA